MYSAFIADIDIDDAELSAAACQADTAGLVEERGGVRVFFHDRGAVDRFETILGRRFRSVRREREVDWQRVSEEAWQPFPAGDRLWVTPPWRQDPAPPGRLRLEINPGMACGTGRHPCTQLCLQALEQCLHPGAHMLDVGSGSGILVRAAALLGAAAAVGCDIDPEAVQVSRRDIEASFFVGSVSAVRSRSMDVLAANISSEVAEELADEFARVRKLQSWLILSGFREDDLPRGFTIRETLEKQGWICLIC